MRTSGFWRLRTLPPSSVVRIEPFTEVARPAATRKLGGRVVAAEIYTSEATDFRTQLTQLISANPDGIFLAAQGEFSGGTIIKCH